MPVRKKTIKRTEWKGIEKRRYAFSAFAFDGLPLSGEAGLMWMDSVKNPFSVLSFDRNLTITHEGYSWLHLAFSGEDFWATVMFDEKGELFQYYFDVVLESHVLPDGEAWFTDLYLDVIMRRGGERITLDEEELMQACSSGEITLCEYQKAIRAEKRILALTEGSESVWLRECEKLRKKLLARMN